VFAADPGPPKLLVPDLKLELLAAEPDLVTPIGAAVDSRGRIFVVESHTHFPKADYPGPKSDRILIFSGTPGEKPTVFAEGFRWAMNLVFAPDDSLFLTHRNGVVRLEDKDADGKADAPRTILQMETKGDYPHNGIGGIAFAADGALFLGIGENLGLEYTVRGSDQSAVFAPAGAGGIIVRCQPDGSKLELWATGFWNAFALEFDAHGRLFMVDNDPDSRPPCRLLHVIRDGYYGFQFRHGRNGLSPFTAWDGELPGTLPMVAGTGEAPSAVLDARRTKLPAAFAGTLLVSATWDHAIERFRPVAAGASLRAEREVIIQGDADFRPVALAAAPDGSVVITDWVKSDYSVHRHGRLWRLSSLNRLAQSLASLPPVSGPERSLNRLFTAPSPPADSLASALASEDPHLHSAAITQLAAKPQATITNTLRAPNPRVRTAALLALRKSVVGAGYPANDDANRGRVVLQPARLAGQAAHNSEAPVEILRTALNDPSSEVRTAALVWIGEDRLTQLRADADRALTAGPVTPLLLAVHAETVKWLSSGTDTGNLKSEISNLTPLEVRLLNLAPTDTARLARAIAILRQADSPAFQRLDAIRDLAGSHDTNAVATLQTLVRDPAQPAAHRAEAVLALTGSHEDHLTELLPVLATAPAEVQLEFVRGLRSWLDKPGVRDALTRLAATQPEPRLQSQLQLALGQSVKRPASDDAWRAALKEAPGDAAIGRRVFFSPGASCGKCHRVEGRGGLVGTDLSTIARAADREKLMQSILNPSRDVAPQFAQHIVETRDGETYAGRIFSEGADGSLTLLNGESSAFVIPKALIHENQPNATSLMPDGLADGMTVQDFRDLIAYLEARR
jgi:putative membrane-bound dehydrogenase-like protein